MSQAEDLLRSIVEDSDEAHIVVGLDRKITVPAELKNIAVQYDTNVRTVTFDIPRHYDGRDLYAMTLFVYCHRPDGTVNSYPAENVSIDAEDEEILHFKWTITSAVTSLPGNIKISISAKSFDESGNVDKRWSSEINDDLVISPNYQSDDVLEEESPDTVSQIYSKIDTVEKALSNHDHDTRYYRKEVLDESLVAPDWNQNDESAPDYIKNRPFYRTPSKITALDNKTYSFENMVDAVYISFDGMLPVEFVEGKSATVTWDGTAYECTVIGGFIGNTSILGGGDDTGEPFCINNSADNGFMIATKDSSETHTVSLSLDGYNYNTLSVDYIQNGDVIEKIIVIDKKNNHAGRSY